MSGRVSTGISHFFEHMMFNGAKKFGPKQFDTEMEKAGGNNDAYTSRTLPYTGLVPLLRLKLIFDMEADRIRDLEFDPKMFESERGVVAIPSGEPRSTTAISDSFGSS